MHRYASYGWLRGVNIIPAWGATLDEAWWDYDGARLREELALVRRFHVNTIRLWIEHSPWVAKPDPVVASFMDAVAAVGEAGMKVMPCLFNRWHDGGWDYGGTCWENLYSHLPHKLEYVRALVGPLANDDRVLMWDLCNEPNAHSPEHPTPDIARQELALMRAVRDEVRACGAQQPITIGVWGAGGADYFADLVDVLSCHCYPATRDEVPARLDPYRDVQRKHGKPMVCTESCKGALDDRVRADVIRFTTEPLVAAGYGYMTWSIKEGKAVASRRDRMDGNGVNGQGWHPLFYADGRPRAGLEFLEAEPAQKAPWL